MNFPANSLDYSYVRLERSTREHVNAILMDCTEKSLPKKDFKLKDPCFQKAFCKITHFRGNLVLKFH